jgi:DNA-binding CsgD family transcriptional regulator
VKKTVARATLSATYELSPPFGGREQTFVVRGDEPDRTSLDLQRAGIAVVDRAGNVSWADPAWLSWTEESGGVVAAQVGANLLAIARGSAHIPPAIAAGLSAVLEERAAFFEIEYEPPVAGTYAILFSAARLHGAGAVVVQRLADPRPLAGIPRHADLAMGAPPPGPVPPLTPREAEVLSLMAKGLDNRAIAKRLGIAYTTVRGHVREIIGKLGARSRLQAVARAYQRGLIGR